MDTHLIEAFEKGTVQLFIGSGLSKGIYPDSSELCNQLLNEQIYVDGRKKSLSEILAVQSPPPLQNVAEYYEIYNQPQQLLALIKRLYGHKRNCTMTHANLWKLPGVRMIYTTNYDGLIEEGLQSPLASPVVATQLSQLEMVHSDSRVVFKPHGCACTSTQRSEFVITRSDYLNYSSRRVLEGLKTLYDILTRTFLFLGYSLSDANIHQLIVDANRLNPNIRAYAVVDRLSAPEVRYWESLNVKLIEMDASQFVENALKVFPPDASEWAQKVERRMGEKDKIANIAVDMLKKHCARSTVGVNVIIDSGTTCLAFAKALLKEIEDTRVKKVVSGIPGEGGGSQEQRNRCLGINPNEVTIITNSAQVVSAVTQDARALEGGLKLFSTGGFLKPGTQALIFGGDGGIDAFVASQKISVQYEIGGKAKSKREIGRKRATIAFLGVTSVTGGQLQTKTEDEVRCKEKFLEVADKVYLLLDHSKLKEIVGPKHVIKYKKEHRIVCITDRRESFMAFEDMGFRSTYGSASGMFQEFPEGLHYKVVINPQEQYAIWPVDLGNPEGWEDVGVFGKKQACVDHIEEVWTDMRPLDVHRELAREVRRGK